MNKQDWCSVGRVVRDLKGELVKIVRVTDDHGVYTEKGVNYCRTELTALENGLNGYRYGVVYPVLDYIPTLPEGTYIRWYDTSDSSETKSHMLFWAGVTSFQVIDERYKPQDNSCIETPVKLPVSDASDWWDYEAQKPKHNKLPPIGEKVEVFLHWSESWSGWVVIVGHDHGGVIWRNGSDNKSYIYSPKDEIRPLDYNRKAEAEKNRVVDTACDVIGRYDLVNILRKLYDAGFLRISEEKQ